MTKSTSSYVQNTALTAAAYLGFQGVLSAQLNAVLTKTTDTGQITSFNTVPVPTVRDYEVFRFTDSLQATAPIFIKVNWAQDTSTLTYMNVSVGTSTNGAGTLGGVTVANLALYGAAPTNTPTRYVYASSDGSQLVFVANLQAVAATGGDALAAIIVERTRDADGTPNAAGYMVYQWKTTTDTAGAVGTVGFTGVYPRLNDPGAVQPAVGYDYGVNVPNLANLTTGLNGSTVAAYPVYGYNTAITGASKALMLGYPGDWPKEVVTPITHYGAALNFLPLPQVGANVPYSTGNTGTVANRVLCPLMRWE